MSIFTDVLHVCNECCHPNNVTDDTKGTTENEGRCDDCGKKFTVMRALYCTYEEMQVGYNEDEDFISSPPDEINQENDDVICLSCQNVSSSVCCALTYYNQAEGGSAIVHE